MENHKLNANEIFKGLYEKASGLASTIAETGVDLEIEVIKVRYKSVLKKYKKTFYLEEGYIKKILCVRELVKLLKLDELGIFYEAFNSPTEVLAFVAAMYRWSPKFIKINQLDPTEKYEIDLKFVDDLGNTVLLLDVQGEVHRTPEQQAKDIRKKRYFEGQNIMYIQIEGTKVKNNWIALVAIITNAIAISLNDVQVEYLDKHQKIKRKSTVYRKKT